MQNSLTEFRKFAQLLIAFAIAAYAIYGLTTDDLVMPYNWGSSGYRGHGHTRFLHLHGMWAIGGSICLLLGAAGFGVLFLETPRIKADTKPGMDPYRYLATVLITVGALFFLGVTYFAQWFVR